MTKNEIKNLYAKVCRIEKAEEQLENLINSKDLVIRIYKYEGKYPIISIDTDSIIKSEAVTGKKY